MSSSDTPLCHIVTPVGMLGCGFDEPQTADALARLVATNVPTAIILDSGSTDSGPSKLALGTMSCPRSAYTRDLAKLLSLVHTFHVPLIFSSAGGSGTDAHVREMLQVIQEITEEKENAHYRFKTIALFSNIPHALVHSRLATNAITGCGPCVPPLTPSAVDATPTIVAQMGPEPFVDAMAATPDFDVLVAGRANDPAPYVAWASFIASQSRSHSFPSPSQSFLLPSPPSSPTEKPDAITATATATAKFTGGLAHMGQVLECGGACATPKSLGAVATVYPDGAFDVAPLDPAARCTPLSVAAHTLYEKGRPDLLLGPGGELDVAGATYEARGDGRTVGVRGSEWRASRRDEGVRGSEWRASRRDEGEGAYRVKLEGATTTGYRTMFTGNIRDAVLVDQLDDLLARVKAYVAAQHRGAAGWWELGFHTYGRRDRDSGVFLIGEALAESQQLATSVACTARIATTHAPYPGQKATSGNLAFGIGGQTEIPLGACPEFSIYHLMDLQPGEERLRLDGEIADVREDGHVGSRNGEADAAATGLFTQSVSILGRGEARQRPPRNGPVRPVHIPATRNGTPPPNGEKQSYAAAREDDKASSPSSSTDDGLTSCATLGQLARVLRSKNAGPYELTFDVMFGSEPVYRLVRESGLLGPKSAAGALGFAEGDVTWCGFFDPARAFKITVPRVRAGKRAPAGGFMEDDVHGSQRYRGLADLELSETLREGLAKLQGLNRDV